MAVREGDTMGQSDSRDKLCTRPSPPDDDGNDDDDDDDDGGCGCGCCGCCLFGAVSTEVPIMYR